LEFFTNQLLVEFDSVPSMQPNNDYCLVPRLSCANVIAYSRPSEHQQPPPEGPVIALVTSTAGCIDRRFDGVTGCWGTIRRGYTLKKHASRCRL
jgi:hypothetical protein